MQGGSTGGGPELDGEDDAAEPSVLWGVGAVSQRLGIATPTLRTWDRRYGLGPSERTEGGHRRYSELDVARVARMSQLIAEGVPPSQAARVSQRSVHDPGAVLSRGPALPLDDSALSGRAVTMTINSMQRAAAALDSSTLSKMLAQVFDRRGVLAGWTDIVAPVLIAVGDAWARGETGIETEHLASECVQTELRHRIRSRHGRRPVTAPVLLASAADEQHSLPVVALAAALAERRINTRMLGARTPVPAMASAIELLAPRVVFLWSSMPVAGGVSGIPAQNASDAPMVVMLGGPGWEEPLPEVTPPTLVEQVLDLPSTVERITTLVG